MTSSFKIPKTKQLGGSDLSHMHMQSPLSRLETSTPDLMVFQPLLSSFSVTFMLCEWQHLILFTSYMILIFQFGSINVKTDRRHSGNTFGSSSNKQRFVMRSIPTCSAHCINNCINSSETLSAVFSAQCKPFFRNAVRNLLGLNTLNRGASTANHRTAGGLSQRAESSACFSNG